MREVEINAEQKNRIKTPILVNCRAGGVGGVRLTIFVKVEKSFFVWTAVKYGIQKEKMKEMSQKRT